MWAGTAARPTILLAPLLGPGKFCLDMKWLMTHTGFMLNGNFNHRLKPVPLSITE